MITLAVAYVHFTVFDPADFTKSVSKRVNNEYIKNEIAQNITVISNNYGFDPKFITPLLDEIDFKKMSEEYVEKFYNAFLNEEDLPVLDFSTDIFVSAIENNYSSSLHPELYEVEENRLLLAEKYNEAINFSVSTLSIDSLNSVLSEIRVPFLKFTNIGRYFTPLAIVFIVLLEVLLFLLINNKRTGSLYSLLLTLFTISLLFTIPFGYLNSQDLISRFNVNLGAGFAYIEAIWNLMITSAANIFAVVSSVLLAGLLAVSISAVFRKSRHIQ